MADTRVDICTYLDICFTNKQCSEALGCLQALKSCYRPPGSPRLESCTLLLSASIYLPRENNMRNDEFRTSTKSILRCAGTGTNSNVLSYAVKSDCALLPATFQTSLRSLHTESIVGMSCNRHGLNALIGEHRTRAPNQQPFTLLQRLIILEAVLRAYMHGDVCAKGLWGAQAEDDLAWPHLPPEHLVKKQKDIDTDMYPGPASFIWCLGAFLQCC